jgi:hypothetical protein
MGEEMLMGISIPSDSLLNDRHSFSAPQICSFVRIQLP